MDAIADLAEVPAHAWITEVATADRGGPGPGRARSWPVYVGFGIGIVVGLALTVFFVHPLGYSILFEEIVFNLIWAPLLGACLGYYHGRGRRVGPWKWKWSWMRPQLRTRTLMVVVAYVALVLGAGIWAKPISTSALTSFLKYSNSQSLATVFEEVGRTQGSDALRRRTNVEGMREGKIPKGLLVGQQKFLQSLEVDPTVSPEFRQYRRDLILKGEERHLSMAEHNVVIYRDLLEYHKKLIRKYDLARRSPWLPVEPDPTPPPDN